MRWKKKRETAPRARATLLPKKKRPALATGRAPPRRPPWRRLRPSAWPWSPLALSPCRGAEVSGASWWGREESGKKLDEERAWLDFFSSVRRFEKKPRRRPKEKKRKSGIYRRTSSTFFLSLLQKKISPPTKDARQALAQQVLRRGPRPRHGSLPLVGRVPAASQRLQRRVVQGLHDERGGRGIRRQGEGRGRRRRAHHKAAFLEARQELGRCCRFWRGGR